MPKYYHPDSDYYRKKLGVEPPKATPHVTEEEMANNMQRLMPNSWTLEGNELVGMTEMGELRQTIPTDYICTGTDDKGLPILKKVVL